MDRRCRLVIYLIFAIIFLITAPTVVLYTAGYRIHLTSRRIVHTGVLSVSSIPRGADIWVDGQITGKRTPAILSNLLPGERRIRLTREGYVTWEKSVSVHSRDTTFVKETVLYAETKPANIMQADASSGTNASRTYLATWRTSDTGSELWVLPSDRSVPALLFRLPPEAHDAEIQWSADAGYLSVLSVGNGQRVMRIIRTETGEPLELDQGTQETLNLWWDQRRPERLYRTTKDAILVYDLPNRVPLTLPFQAEAVLSEGADFFVIQKVGNQDVLSLWREKVSRLITYLPAGSYRFATSPLPQTVLLEDLQHGRLIFVDTSGNAEPILLNAHVISWQWNSEKTRLLYTDGLDLQIYNAANQQEETLTRLSEPITSVAWHPSSNAVLFAQNTRIASLELDSSGSGRVQQTLAAGNQIQSLMVDSRGRLLTYFGAEENGPTGIFQRILQR